MRSIVRFAFLTVLFTAAPAFAASRNPAKEAAPAGSSLLQGLDLYQIDTPHSPIEFSIAFMGLSRVHGAFGDFTGAIAVDRADFTRSSVTVVIRTPSLTTFNAQRDKDLKGANWFDVEKYPLAVFTSREIVKQGSGYLLRGSLTLHGVTKDVEMPIAKTGHFKGPGGDDVAGFEGHTKLNRKDYGIIGTARMNALLEIGQATVGDEVDLPLTIEAFHPALKDTLPDRAADSLFRAVITRGVAPVERDYRALRATTPDSLMQVGESQINGVAFQMVERGKPAEAVELFKLEAEFFPQSASGPSGLAYAYATAGDRANAIASAEKAVALNPGAARALEILRRVKPGT